MNSGTIEYTKPMILTELGQHAGKLTVYRLSKMFKRHPATIYKYATELGISLEVGDSPYLRTGERRQEIWDYVKNNHKRVTAKEAADELDIPRATAYWYAWQLGVSFRKAGEVIPPEMVSEDELFNEHEQENWLI